MVARLRVSTSGTAAASDDYGNGAPTAGRTLYSGGPGAAPTWGAPPVGVAPIAQTFVVDVVNFSATPDGTLGAPYQTIQAAINRAVALGWTFVQLLIAPGTYAGAIAIPNGMQVAFTGWSQNALAIIGGDITITGGIGASDRVAFENCFVSAANLRAADPATQDIDLWFANCEVAAAIAGFNILATWQDSTQLGNVTASGGLVASWDDWSWSHTLNLAPLITAVGVHTRNMWGAGHDTYPQTITVNGVAINATAFVALPVPAYVRADDHVSVQVANPAVQDFKCGVHGVDAGSVVVWLENLSRVSTNFADDVLLLVHHNHMIVEV